MRLFFRSAAVFAIGLCLASVSLAGNTTRHYDFEEGVDGQAATLLPDVVTDTVVVGTRRFDGRYWVEVPGFVEQPLPAGNLQDVVTSSVIPAPALEPFFGGAEYADVSNSSPLNSPAPGSQVALRFDGSTLYDDFATGQGTRGVLIDQAAYDANEPVVEGENTFLSFSVLAQAWVRPDSSASGTAQTVFQIGTDQGSINITSDGFWEAGWLGSVGDLTTSIPVEFDTWTHVGVHRGGTGAEMYINGAKVAGNLNPNPSNFFSSFADLVALGADRDGLDGFTGLVDDFKILGESDGTLSLRDMDFWDREEESLCDFNSDESCSIDDLNLMLNAGPIASPVPVTGSNDMFDLNSDDVVDLQDLEVWLAEAAEENGLGSPYLSGDANLDGVVDVSDFNLWNGNKFTNTLDWNGGDFNGDGVVDVSDFNRWNSGKFSTSDTALVPEPGCLPTLLVGMALIMIRSRGSHRKGS